MFNFVDEICGVFNVRWYEWNKRSNVFIFKATDLFSRATVATKYRAARNFARSEALVDFR